MIIRQGTSTEMMKLWYKFHTSEFFSDNLHRGNAEFWVIDDNGGIIGELYLFKSLDDHDLADGRTTAYLYNFRVAENMRGMGLGSRLLDHVFERLRQLGFRYATIGVDPGEEGNMRLYSKMGFAEKIKILREDLCDVDESLRPAECPEYIVLRKTL